jgi:osmotically-inducible protein OsmY
LSLADAIAMSRVDFLLPLALLTLCGCSNQDQDHLARCGRKVADRLENIIHSDGKLAAAWQGVRGSSGETAPDARVEARLRWDKVTADAQIQVKAADGVVELKGTVRDLDQRRRAVELAEGTVGVQRVTDSLEIPAP